MKNEIVTRGLECPKCHELELLKSELPETVGYTCYSPGCGHWAVKVKTEVK